MLIPKVVDLFALQKEGRLTLQIPNLIVENNHCITYESIPLSDKVEYPDNWFMKLSANTDSPYLSNKNVSYFLYWSKIGYLANKEEMKRIFDTAIRGKSWEEFEQYADKFFNQINEKVLKRLAKLQKEKDFLENFLIEME